MLKSTVCHWSWHYTVTFSLSRGLAVHSAPVAPEFSSHRHCVSGQLEITLLSLEGRGGEREWGERHTDVKDSIWAFREALSSLISSGEGRGEREDEGEGRGRGRKGRREREGEGEGEERRGRGKGGERGRKERDEREGGERGRGKWRGERNGCSTVCTLLPSY